MAEQGIPDFSFEEQQAQAAGNWWALYARTVEYLREQGHSPEQFVGWLGRRFAPGWEDARGNLEAIARSVALNPVALGGELRGYAVDENEATVRVAPPSDLVAFDRPGDADLINEVYGPIMEHLDVDFEWRREGEEIVFILRPR